MSKREKERVEKAFAWAQRKLCLKYNLIFEPFVAAKDPVGKDAHLAVKRSLRKTEDPECFIICYDSKNIKERSFKALKHDALHELIHFTNWKKQDVFDDACKHIKNSALKKSLADRYYDADEHATYTLARAVGPFIIKGYNKTL
jgi:hypothetical protein